MLDSDLSQVKEKRIFKCIVEVRVIAYSTQPLYVAEPNLPAWLLLPNRRYPMFAMYNVH